MTATQRRLLLVRHGETDHNSEGRTISTIDPPLNDNGLRQADALAQELAGLTIGYLLSSPRLRCRQTADSIARLQPNAPMQFDERLTEVGLGELEGLSRREVTEAGLDDVFHSWRQGSPPQYPSGAETFEAAALRLAEVFRRLPSEGTVVVVGHSHALRILIATEILGVPAEIHRRIKLDHARVAEVRWEGPTPRLVGLNLDTVGDL